MFKKVLIANRGEIAVRIAQTLQEMGITAVAVYSQPDRGALHVRAADEAYPLDGVTSAETYLRGDKIIDIARRHGAEAIHPGYGFLAENDDFARGCLDAGLVFIGPSPEVIAAMGDKIAAKKAFADAGVPVVPGWSGNLDVGLDALRREARAIGYPVLVKAAAGGGGKGMRMVREEAELPAALEAAQREAGAAFGDARVFLEKYIARARHVEFQVFGDSRGNVVHLFERECSIQRRYQKIIEESPSPALSPQIRQKMGEAAVRAARAIGYTNAGTVEFLLDDAGRFYFLEVNTRLQVEHPVTEMLVRRDLVRAQVLVAAGEALPFRQEDLAPDGHAIECRVYAEDPARGFVPAAGTIVRCVVPTGPNIRIDSGIGQGSEVSVHYDPLLAKLIVWGASREAAVARAIRALESFVILGVTTNVEFLRNVLDHGEFRAGRTHTHFLEENPVPASCEEELPDAALIVAAWALHYGSGRSAPRGATAPAARAFSNPWQAAGAWRAF